MTQDNKKSLFKTVLCLLGGQLVLVFLYRLFVGQLVFSIFTSLFLVSVWKIMLFSWFSLAQSLQLFDVISSYSEFWHSLRRKIQKYIRLCYPFFAFFIIIPHIGFFVPVVFVKSTFELELIIFVIISSVLKFLVKGTKVKAKAVGTTKFILLVLFTYIVFGTNLCPLLYSKFLLHS
jgi:hypothetical protein